MAGEGASGDRFLDGIVAWAGRRRDIVAVVMTGSRARPDAIVDEMSDYDLEIFTTNPELYTSSAEWMAEIAEVWVCLPLTSRRGCPTRLVVFEGGSKVDFSIFPVGELEEMVQRQALDELYVRGFRVLQDRWGLAARLPAPSLSPPARSIPAEDEFRAAVEEFWFEASHMPKYLQRGELWVVKYRDWTMKELLLRMLEWHAAATSGERPDVWHMGMRMSEWARPDVWEGVQQVFGRFDAGDSWGALLATVSLFRRAATETAAKLGYAYPRKVDEAISGYLRKFEGRFQQGVDRPAGGRSLRPIVLASASPRRHELLGRLGVPFEVAAPEIEEDLSGGQRPERLARRLAAAKALAAAAAHPDRDVLAADTLVIDRGVILGKPATGDEAREMLRGLRGKGHRVITGIAVVAPGRGRPSVAHARTQVRMRPYSDDEIEASIARGDPFDKAGAYAIQDELFRPVASYEGCYCNVVGLPLWSTIALLQRSGVEVGEPDVRLLLPQCAACPARQEV